MTALQGKERVIAAILMAAVSLSAFFLFSGFALDLARMDVAGISGSGLIKTGLYTLFVTPLLRVLASAFIYAQRRDIIFSILSLYAAAVILVVFFYKHG